MSKETASMSLMANAIRFLSADAIEKSQSGHPGMPWAWLMWQRFCSQSSSSSPPKHRAGLIGIGLSYRRGMAQCCFILCYI